MSVMRAAFKAERVETPTTEFAAASGDTEPAARGAVLLVGFSPGELAVGSCVSPDFVHARTGVAALQQLANPARAAAIDLVVAADELRDMSGTALLGRVETLQPEASRVLLLDPETPVPTEAELLDHGVHDAWRGPLDGVQLERRIRARRPWLARIRRLQAEVARSRTSVAEIQQRYARTRTERDRLALRVEEALAAADPGAPSLAELSAWWHGYRGWRQLRDLALPAEARVFEVASLGEFLGERVGHAVRTVLSRAEAAPPVRLDPLATVRGLQWLSEGCAALAKAGDAEDSAPDWWLEATATGSRLVFSSAPLPGEIAALPVGRLTDPFARLGGEPLAGACFALPFAEAQLSSLGLDPVLSWLGGRLRCELVLPAAGANETEAPFIVTPD